MLGWTDKLERNEVSSGTSAFESRQGRTRIALPQEGRLFSVAPRTATPLVSHFPSTGTPSVRRTLLASLYVILSASPLVAQPEVVPAEHAIYDFFLAERIAGRLPEYRHEIRPHDRATVQRHLDSLTVRGQRQSGVMQRWLSAYRQEFFEPAEAIDAVIKDGSFHFPTFSGNERFLYHYRDDEWRLALRATGRFQYRAAEDSIQTNGFSLSPEGTLEGNYKKVVGFYSGTYNGQQIGGDTRVLAADPELAPQYYVARNPNPPGSFDRSTVSLRAVYQSFFAELAHERLEMGPSYSQSLFLSDNADYVDFLRAGIDTRYVQYQFVHAALGDRSAVQPTGNGLVAPERYLAIHRLAVHPFSVLSLAFTEAVVYGLRGPELAYLNPLYPIKPAEHALWDRDNSLFALDAVLRPLPGIEAYGTYVVDDLDFAVIGQNSYNYKWGVQAGAAVSLDALLPGTTGFGEYTRLEPFLFTHRFEQDGSFYNSYQHNGYGLGHSLGPNSDQWLVGVDVRLPLRSHLRALGRYVRRGENFVDPETGDLVNVGGDIRNGTQPPFQEFSKAFLRGDVFEGLGGRLELTVEPVRGLAFLFYGDYQQWDNDPDQLFVRGELRVTL